MVDLGLDSLLLLFIQNWYHRFSSLYHPTF